MKKKVGVIFGGKSTESKISVISAKTVIDNLDETKYDIHKIFIDKNDWYTCDRIDDEFNIINKSKIDNIISFIKDMDTIFPVLHGKYGEDGTIQGMFEMFDIPYVGCKVLSSSVCMDKVYTKMILEKANINQCKYISIKQENNDLILISNNLEEEKKSINEIVRSVTNKLNYPVFVKPSRSGSSIGVSSAKIEKDLEEAILDALKYDNEILIEEGIKGREIECAVLGNTDVIASPLGEIIPDEVFYSYDSKYKNNESKLIIPANIDKETSDEIRKTAIKAYKAIGCTGLSRVDFFLSDDNCIYLNEINTLPGFTSISMYPMLIKEYGIELPELLDKLIELSFEK